MYCCLSSYATLICAAELSTGCSTDRDETLQVRLINHQYVQAQNLSAKSSFSLLQLKGISSKLHASA